MWVAGQAAQPKSKGTISNQEKLDRALVAGLILEVVLDQPDLPESRQARQRLVKARIRDYLVQHLAGQVSLDRFRRLAQNLDGWFEFYYPLVAPDSRPAAAPGAAVTYGVREPRAAYEVNEPQAPWPHRRTDSQVPPPVRQACWEELLDNWLAAAQTDMPQRSHRKLTPTKLKDFLSHSSGRWFRLRDFERFIPLDRKTAWDYVHQFVQQGLLCHNRKNSAAVRYCLAPSFLKVKADALRLALSLILGPVDDDLVEKISDFLIATGGETFHVSEWERDFPAPGAGQLLEELTSRQIVVWQHLATGASFLKLHSRWLAERREDQAPGQPPGDVLYSVALEPKLAP